MQRGYISAIIQLYNRQIALSEHNYPSLKSLAIKAHLKAVRAEVWRITRETFKDRALGSIMDGYNHEDIYHIVNTYWKEKGGKKGYKTYEVYLRTSLNFLIGHYFLL